MNTNAELLERIRELTARINARMDGTPNLRDYWPDLDGYRVALDNYHDETSKMRADREALAELRLARRQVGRLL